MPFVFVTDPHGVGLLLNFRGDMGWSDVVWQVLLATIGLAALAASCQGFLRRALATWERVALVVAGLLMMFPALLEAIAPEMVPYPHLVGVVIALGLLSLQWRTPTRLA
jgi:TRAP-type uncharacterized transport system fused permease subunit